MLGSMKSLWLSVLVIPGDGGDELRGGGVTEPPIVS